MNRNSERTNPTRQNLGLATLGLGALLLLVVPVLFVVLAITGGSRDLLPGTFVILSATLGMALIAIGAALRD